jgi:hypothetical protein
LHEYCAILAALSLASKKLGFHAKWSFHAKDHYIADLLFIARVRLR